MIILMTQDENNKGEWILSSKIYQQNDCADMTKSTTNVTDNLENILSHYSHMKSYESNAPITLNIGGYKYCTLLTTITKYKDSLLYEMFNNNENLMIKCDDGSYFIDRDGKIFEHILTYLRYSDISLIPLNDKIIERKLLYEAEYYRIHQLITDINDAKCESH